MEKTRYSLLQAFKTSTTHKQPWKEFYRIYGPVVVAYGRKIGLRPDQADDVLQETMVALMQILPDFIYDETKGKFRNFLLTIVHRKALAAIRRGKRRDPIVMAPDDVAFERVVSAASDEENEIPLPFEERQDIWQESILDQAMTLLLKEPSIKKQTLDIFSDYVVNGMSPTDVAEKYDIKENAVYQVKNRMIKQLRKIADELMCESE